MSEVISELETEPTYKPDKPVFPIPLSTSDLENLCSGTINATLVGGEEFDPSQDYTKNPFFPGKIRRINNTGFSFVYKIDNSKIDNSKIGESRTIIPSEIEEESSLLDGIISKARLYQQDNIYIVVGSHTNLHYSDDSKYLEYKKLNDYLESKSL